jgi:hypothetical protein
MANWLDKYEQGGLVLKKKTKDNYGKRENANEGYSTAGPGWVGEGTTNRGFDYNGAWGGTMQMGGSMPGAVGFTYARTVGAAPSNGPYAKKTKASAQNGQEMKFYQEGLDFVPKSISQNGLLMDRFKEKKPLSDATRVAAPIRPLTKKELEENVRINKQTQKNTEALNKAIVADRKSKRETKGDVNVPGSFNIAEKFRLFPESVGGMGEMFDEYLNPGTFVGVLADSLGESVAARSPEGVAATLAMTLGAGALGFDPLTSVSKAPRKLLNAADRNFSDVGQRLVQIEKQGLKKGWDPQTIKQKQMDVVGITSSQREAYTPVLSDLAEKYVTPYGYSGMQGESKLQQVINNIKQGGVKFPKTDNSLMRTEVSPERSDAWRLYLGKPQQHHTFRIANTSPVNHPSYTPEQLSKMDIYSINSNFGKLGVKPTTEFPNLVSPREIEQNMNMLRNKTTVDTGNEIMGGYNRRLNQYGLEYNDIWDLQPAITPANYLPNNLKYTLGESPLFSKTSKEGVISPRSFKIDGSMFLGKPFMSHEVLPYTSTNLKEEMENIIKRQMDDLKNSKFDFDVKFEKLVKSGASKETIDKFLKKNPGIMMVPKINKLEAYKEELKQYPKYKKGGWLNKYK